MDAGRHSRLSVGFDALLRCVECEEDDPLESANEIGGAVLRCSHGHVFPVIAGIPRLLREPLRRVLIGRARTDDATARTMRRTAEEDVHFVVEFPAVL